MSTSADPLRVLSISEFNALVANKWGRDGGAYKLCGAASAKDCRHGAGCKAIHADAVTTARFLLTLRVRAKNQNWTDRVGNPERWVARIGRMWRVLTDSRDSETQGMVHDMTAAMCRESGEDMYVRPKEYDSN